MGGIPQRPAMFDDAGECLLDCASFRPGVFPRAQILWRRQGVWPFNLSSKTWWFKQGNMVIEHVEKHVITIKTSDITRTSKIKHDWNQICVGLTNMSKLEILNEPIYTFRRLVPWCPVRAGPDTVRKGSSMARSSQHVLSSGHGIRWVIAQLASAQMWPAEIEEVSNYHHLTGAKRC